MTFFHEEWAIIGVNNYFIIQTKPLLRVKCGPTNNDTRVTDWTRTVPKTRYVVTVGIGLAKHLPKEQEKDYAALLQYSLHDNLWAQHFVDYLI